MRVLVTGGGGFVGKKIIQRCLQRGYFVRSFSRSPQPHLEALGVEVLQGDITDPISINNAIFDVDTIFHTAAKAEMWGSWDSFYNTNVRGTRNIINAYKTHGVDHLIYTSTPSVVFSGQDLKNADESQPYGENWLCHYAHTKRIAEEEALAAGAIALRPHLIYGPDDPHFTPKLLELGKKKKLKIIGDGHNYVDFTHVENVADAHMLALDALINNKHRGEAYFITDGQPQNLWDWIQNFLKSHNLPPITKKISFKKAYFIAQLCEFFYKCFNIQKMPPMTKFIATELAKNHYFNINKAKNQLNYQPKEYNEYKPKPRK